MIIKNAACYYPIGGVRDIILGVNYRNSKKGWTDGCVFLEWLDETSANVTLPAAVRV